LLTEPTFHFQGLNLPLDSLTQSGTHGFESKQSSHGNSDFAKARAVMGDDYGLDGSTQFLRWLAARIGISHLTLADVLSDSRQPMAKTMMKLRAFLDAEAKRNAGSNGIKPTEPEPMKILKPTRYSLYTRLCPFCRKARGKIQSVSRKQFEGTCPKCGASGPTRGSEQLARRA
jgi:hypothetical protein